MQQTERHVAATRGRTVRRGGCAPVTEQVRRDLQHEGSHDLAPRSRAKTHRDVTIDMLCYHRSHAPKAKGTAGRKSEHTETQARQGGGVFAL